MLAAGAPAAQAAPLRGSFAISGIVIPVNGATGQPVTDSDGNATFDDGNGQVVTGLDFLNQDLSNPSDYTGDFRVVNTKSVGGQNDFASLLGTTGRIRDFTFEGPGSLAFPTVPLFAFESLSSGTLTFDLTKIFVKYRDANTLTLTGAGFFNWAGYDRTPGSFEFTATNSFGSIAFVASEAAPTPEPASLLLMGSGALLGLRSYRKRRMIAV